MKFFSQLSIVGVLILSGFVLIACGSSSGPDIPPKKTYLITYEGSANASLTVNGASTFNAETGTTVFMKADVNLGYQFDSGPTYTVFNSSDVVLPVTVKNGGVELIMPSEDIRVVMTGSVVLFHTCTVIFDHDNGTSATVQTEKGTTLVIPTLPTKSNYAFRGWYSDRNGQGTRFERGVPINGNSTVYAFWQAIHVGDGVIDYPSEEFDDAGISDNDGCTSSGKVESGYCAVIFDLQNDTYVYSGRLILSGTTCSSFPANPIRNGYTFAGWFTEPENAGDVRTVASIFSSNTVLYAHWTTSL